MKKFICIIIACVIIVSGCSKTEVETENHDITSMFVCVEDSYNWKVVYHKYTKVMYAISNGSHTHGIFTLLVNPDGSPMIWEGIENNE